MKSPAGLAKTWIVDVGSLTAADVARCDAVLDPQEREQVGRFRFDPDRDAYRAAHALARIALSSFEPSVSPRDWVFESASRGRPEVAATSGLPALRFNISHTRGMVACIVTRSLDCGVDIESVDRCRDWNRLAAAVLAPAELASLRAAPDAQRPLLFSRYWTLKEAYAKGIGLGMAMPFDRITFELDEGSARLVGHAGEWHFGQWSPTRDYTVAAAVRDSVPPRILLRRGLPGGSERA